MKVWVTRNNQAWVSEVSGLSPAEVARLYAQARKDKVICTVIVPDSARVGIGDEDPL